MRPRRSARAPVRRDRLQSCLVIASLDLVSLAAARPGPVRSAGDGESPSNGPAVLVLMATGPSGPSGPARPDVSSRQARRVVDFQSNDLLDGGFAIPLTAKAAPIFAPADSLWPRDF
jgi:hypothetical protein